VPLLPSCFIFHTTTGICRGLKFLRMNPAPGEMGKNGSQLPLLSDPTQAALPPFGLDFGVKNMSRNNRKRKERKIKGKTNWLPVKSFKGTVGTRPSGPQPETKPGVPQSQSTIPSTDGTRLFGKISDKGPCALCSPSHPIQNSRVAAAPHNHAPVCRSASSVSVVCQHLKIQKPASWLK